MAKEKFLVVREHGAFKEGDLREADRTEVAHLIPNCLQPVSEAGGAKAESAPQNKAEPAAPANKAFTGRKAKQQAGEADKGESE